MVAIDDQAADQDECFGVDVLRHYGMHPADGTFVEVRDKELLIVSDQDSRQTVRGVRFREVVAKLRCQLSDVARVRRAGKSYRDGSHDWLRARVVGFTAGPTSLRQGFG